MPLDFEIGVIDIPEAMGIDDTVGATLRLKVLIIFGPDEDGTGFGDTPGLFIFIGGGTNTVLT